MTRRSRPRYARLVAALPATVPFVPPEALERRGFAATLARVAPLLPS